MNLDWNKPMPGVYPVTIPALPTSGSFEVEYGETPAQAAVRTISELREALEDATGQLKVAKR